MHFIQHCFICHPLNYTVSEDAGLEPRTVATLALTVRRSNLSARSHPLHRKKRFTSFPSPAGMSLTKLPLGRNNSVMTSLFPPRESLVVTSRLGTGNSRTFFLRCTVSAIYHPRFRPDLSTLILKILKGWIHTLDGGGMAKDSQRSCAPSPRTALYCESLFRTLGGPFI